MIYTVEGLIDCEPGRLICASDTIMDCINAVNNDSYFPYVADEIEFTAWENGKKVAAVQVTGNRTGWNHDGIEPVTYEEIVGGMVKVNEG
ncbi:hypothetical protein GuL6_123 [Buttiauxella phage vB_ButM_GuL6]|nr:hypothetical protein GuL6_123 [Buttiauxella phage vB_ButM_GuL6]